MKREEVGRGGGGIPVGEKREERRILISFDCSSIHLAYNSSPRPEEKKRRKRRKKENRKKEREVNKKEGK